MKRFKADAKRVASKAAQINLERPKRKPLVLRAVLCEFDQWIGARNPVKIREQLRCCNWIRLPKANRSTAGRGEGGKKVCVDYSLGQRRKPGARIFVRSTSFVPLRVQTARQNFFAKKKNESCERPHAVRSPLNKWRKRKCGNAHHSVESTCGRCFAGNARSSVARRMRVHRKRATRN